MCVQWDLRVHAKLTADIHSPAILVQPSVRLRVILWRNRSSHSVIQPIDLPYVYHSDGRVRKLGNAVTNHAMKEKYTAADVVSYDSNDHDLFVSSVGNERQISWSGCQDSQTSADVAPSDGGLAVGAMSDVSAVCFQ
jgi:hypothetical protein